MKTPPSRTMPPVRVDNHLANYIVVSQASTRSITFNVSAAFRRAWNISPGGANARVLSSGLEKHECCMNIGTMDESFLLVIGYQKGCWTIRQDPEAE